MTDPVDPDRMEKVEFSMVRRGADPAEVRSTLAEAADALRLLQRRNHELERRIETLEGQVPEPDLLDADRDAARAEGREVGEAEGEKVLTAAAAEADALTADAKEQGRALVHEAQNVRRRMLEDLARRRRSLRQQIKQLQAGRERLLEAYEVVGHTMREATQELAVALPEARAAADRAGHGVAPEETVEQLEAEIEAARLAGLPIVAAAPADPEVEDADAGLRRRPVAVPLERDVRDMPEVEPIVADFEAVRLIDDGLDGEDEDPDPVPDSDPDPDPDPVDAGEDRDDVGQPPSAATEPGDESDGGEDGDLFDRLRESRPVRDADLGPAGERDDHPEETDDAEVRSAATTPAESDDPVDGDDRDGFDHPDDAAEPFGVALGAEPADASNAEPARVTAEHELARRVKRLLSDEQNDVLDRLRTTRKRSVDVGDVLGGLDDRVGRVAAAVQPVLADAASVELGADAQPVDDLAAELAREVAEAIADGIVERLEEEPEIDELSGPVRRLYREWKTERIGVLAHRYVEAACEPQPITEFG